MLIDGDPETAWDYAMLQVQDSQFSALPSLELETSNQVNVGLPVALFGYQFKHPKQSIHMGHVSSQYEKAGVHYLQVDSSVNQGNSGGLLIDVETGRVIGIVTRKATGLTSQFDQLLQAFQENILAIEATQRGGGRVLMMGIDSIESMKSTQIQMSRLALEIRRSANAGIGYAYHIKKLRSSLANMSWWIGKLL